MGRRVGRRSGKTQDELAQTANVVEETLQGIASVKAFCNELFEQKRYESRINVFLKAVLSGAKARAALIAFIIFGIFSAIVIVLWYGTTLLLDGQLKNGDLLGFIIYTMFIRRFTRQFCRSLQQSSKIGRCDSACARSCWPNPRKG